MNQCCLNTNVTLSEVEVLIVLMKIMHLLKLLFVKSLMYIRMLGIACSV